MSLKRLLGLSGVVGLLAAVAFAVPSQAATIKASCTVSGDAKTQDKQFAKMGVRLIGGSGSYTFTQTTFSCVGTEKGAPAVVTFNIQSIGKYVNTVCGTGKALSNWGKSTLTGGFLKVGGDPTKGQAFYSNLIQTLKYSVEFQGAVGQFFWHNDGPGPKPESTVKPATIPKLNMDPANDGKFTNDPKIYVYAGEVDLSLPQGKTPVVPDTKQDPMNLNKFNCTKAFHAAGAIVIDV
jgi:hypothetical protein